MQKKKNETPILKHPELKEFKVFLKNHLKSLKPLPLKGHKTLKKSIEYSLFSNGKFFRPLLALGTAELFSIKAKTIFPWMAAMEMIHTASLIHDDLPCMDNSSYRRGKLANHKKFGTPTALLAGDSLWIEAFRVISLYGNQKQKKLWLSILSESISFKGLMGGQALDIFLPAKANKKYYQKMHQLKTGALITASIEGVLSLRKKSKKTKDIKKAGEMIGLAFQLADDLQDFKEKHSPNLTHKIGKRKTFLLLQDVSNKALNLIPTAGLLKNLVIFNLDRVK